MATAKLISIGTLIDESWERYREHTPALLSISGWLLVKAVVDVISLSFYPTASKLLSGANLSGPESFGTVLFVLNAAVIAPLIGVFVLAATFQFVRALLEGKRADVKAALAAGKNGFLPVLLVSILLVLVILGGIAIGVVPPVVLYLIAAWTGFTQLNVLATLLLVLGIIAATILNIRWAVEFSLAPYVTLAEGVRGVKALKRSRELVKSRFVAVLLRYALPKFVFVLLGIVVLAVLAFITNVIVSGFAGLNLDVSLRLNTLASTVYPIAIAALVNPLLIIADTILYRNLADRS